MNVALLSLEQAPPFSVPLRFFLTAPWFALASVLVLLGGGPGVLASRWEPGLLAAVHFFTLGYLAMVMIGAVFQMLPVVAGVQIARPHLASAVVHLLLVAGTLALGTAFAAGLTALFLPAMALLGGAVMVFIGFAWSALWRARSAHDTVCGMKLALVALAITALLGIHLAAGHAGAGAAPARYLTDIHLAWGLLGWVGLLVIGVSYQVVPMFQVTTEYPRRLRRALPWLILALLVLWSLAVLHWPAVRILPGLGLGAAFFWFALKTWHLQQQRLRRLPDATVAFWQVGLVSMLAAVLLWLAQDLLPVAWTPALATAWGVLVILGGGVSLVSGMLYKIVPFLVWLHLNNRMQALGRWQGSIPTMKQVIAERNTRYHLWLHGAALSLWLLAAFLPTLGFYPAAVVLLAACALQGWNLYGALGRYRRILAQATAAA